MSDKYYEFTPLSSINSYELAEILQGLMMISIDESVLGRLPKECKKHFRAISWEDLQAKVNAAKEEK